MCGGQWNRMVQFLAVLIQTVQNNNIELAIFFNGALEQQRLGEWAQKQATRRKNINSVRRKNFLINLILCLRLIKNLKKS